MSNTTPENCQATDPADIDEITRDMGRTDDNRRLPEDYAGQEQEREFVQRLTATVWEWLKKEVEDATPNIQN